MSPIWHWRAGHRNTRGPPRTGRGRGFAANLPPPLSRAQMDLVPTIRLAAQSFQRITLRPKPTPRLRRIQSNGVFASASRRKNSQVVMSQAYYLYLSMSFPLCPTSLTSNPAATAPSFRSCLTSVGPAQLRSRTIVKGFVLQNIPDGQRRRHWRTEPATRCRRSLDFSPSMQPC